jgi:hypothetical protein
MRHLVQLQEILLPAMDERESAGERIEACRETQDRPDALKTSPGVATPSRKGILGLDPELVALRVFASVLGSAGCWRVERVEAMWTAATARLDSSKLT